jgi:electron transport complex protein RnfA
LLNTGNEIITSYPLALLYSVITGLGFTLTTVIFISIHRRLAESDIPEVLRGLPMTLIIAALISLAFGGFAGI